MGEEIKHTHIVVHHSGGATTKAGAEKERNNATAKAIKRFHTAAPVYKKDKSGKLEKDKNGKKIWVGGGRGWSDIAYHMVIVGDGSRQVGRKEGQTGWGVFGSRNDLGVCMSGNFELCEPTSEQINSLVELLVDWCVRHKISPNHIYGHFNTPVGRKKAACPGQNMRSKLDSVKKRVWQEISPPKHRLAARMKDPKIRQLLDQALEQGSGVLPGGKGISFKEMHLIIDAVIGDGRITQQEVVDLGRIGQYLTNVRSKQKLGSSRAQLLLEGFLRDPKKYMEHNAKIKSADADGVSGSGNSTSSTNQKNAEKLASTEFHKRHPERNGKPIQKHEKKAWEEFRALVKKFGGS